MPENVYHNASSQSTIDTGSNNQYYSTDQETNNQQTETDPNAESHYDYDAGVCTNDVVSDNGSSTEASFDPSNISSSEEPESDYTESDSDSEDEEKNYCDENDGENNEFSSVDDYTYEDEEYPEYEADDFSDEDEIKEEDNDDNEEFNNEHSEKFIEENKSLIKKTDDILKFVYPDCDISLAELLTGAEEIIKSSSAENNGNLSKISDNDILTFSKIFTAFIEKTEN